MGTNPFNHNQPYDLGSTWLAAAPYVEAINEKISGHKSTHWLSYFVRKYVQANTRGATCLLLGPNEGHMEFTLRQSGFEGRIIASDIAEKALERARQKHALAGLNGIEYLVADLNNATFKGPFDYVIAEGNPASHRAH